jgi:hypothetical protein
MNIKSQACCIAVLFLFPLAVGSKEDVGTRIEGVVVDITDARIWNATLTFGTGNRDYRTKTRQDGTYSIELKPGTYSMKAESYGFCTLRRSGFVLQKHTTVQFNLQMWLCPTDTEFFVQYTELEEIPHTHLKPLVQYGKKNLQDALWHFRGPHTWDDGTRHSRQYPAVFTFNLLTVQADEIVYDPARHLLSAVGDVRWQDENDSGAAENLQIKMDGLKPRLNQPSPR